MHTKRNNRSNTAIISDTGVFAESKRNEYYSVTYDQNSDTAIFDIFSEVSAIVFI